MTAAAAPLPRKYLVAFWVCLASALLMLAGAAKVLFNPPPREPDLAAGAWNLLEKSNVVPLTADLQAVLADWPRLADRTDEHPLLGKPAPDFALAAADGTQFRLADALRRGPVLVVFYYGYYCDHCVSQLFDLERHRRYFDELGARIVAISADPPEKTREQFAKYRTKGGAFGFAVAADPGNRISQQYGCFQPYEKGPPSKPEFQLHGSFLVDADGIVRWANSGPSPYTNVRTLLGELAQRRNGLPQPARKTFDEKLPRD